MIYGLDIAGLGCEIDYTNHLPTCLRSIYIADAGQALEVLLGAVDCVHLGLVIWNSL